MSSQLFVFRGNPFREFPVPGWDTKQDTLQDSSVTYQCTYTGWDTVKGIDLQDVRGVLRGHNLGSNYEERERGD